MEPPVREPEVAPPATNEELHLLISEMKDELAAYRWREAIWISAVVHVLFFLALALSPKWIQLIPRTGAVVMPVPAQRQQTTYLEMPRDQLKVKPPKTNVVSDKNRIAQSRVPSRETLQKLLDARRAGHPAPPPTPAAPPQAAQQTVPAPAPAQQPAPAQTAENATKAPALSAPQPRQQQSPFATTSPGASLNQAMQSAAASRPRASFGGGDDGMGPMRAHAETKGDLEILSDTMGVDFAPYLRRLHWAVQRSWDPLIPEIAQPPLMKKGVVVIEFAIMKDGSVKGMKLVASSGDTSLDRAAWGAIVNSVPLPPLPANFTADYFLLRAHFYYNPDKNAFE